MRIADQARAPGAVPGQVWCTRLKSIPGQTQGRLGPVTSMPHSLTLVVLERQVCHVALYYFLWDDQTKLFNKHTIQPYTVCAGKASGSCNLCIISMGRPGWFPVTSMLNSLTLLLLERQACHVTFILVFMGRPSPHEAVTSMLYSHTLFSYGTASMSCNLYIIFYSTTRLSTVISILHSLTLFFMEQQVKVLPNSASTTSRSFSNSRTSC